MCFKIFVNLIVIWNCLRNRNMMNINLKYIYIYYLFILKDFMRFMKKRKICYIFNFMNLKYLIHENVLTFLIGFLAHSLLSIIFRCPKHWQIVILG